MNIEKKRNIFLNKSDISFLKNHYLFLDNDFLSMLFYKNDFLKDFISIFNNSEISLLIDPFVEFEFLREVFLPKQQKLKENFLSEDFFTSVENHQEVFLKLQENAILLSRIYAHQNNNNKKTGSSFVDLFLAARSMLLKNSCIITGNKKDFPLFVFDTLAVLNLEEDEGSLKSFCVLKFNEKKFSSCLLKYNKLHS
ncbi:hypothetical protein KKH36_02170 [Patescibacteria group bacterium]|nr:hypothetical protein [Patescibacteria group bacterium]